MSLIVPRDEVLALQQKMDMKQHETTIENCVIAIDKAISDSNYEPNRYDLKTAVNSVISEYVLNNVALVLAAHIQKTPSDPRLSNENRMWAKAFTASATIPDRLNVSFTSHHTLINGFANLFRKAEKEKPSALATLEANVEKSKKQFGKGTPDKSVTKKFER